MYLQTEFYLVITYQVITETSVTYLGPPVTQFTKLDSTLYNYNRNLYTQAN